MAVPKPSPRKKGRVVTDVQQRMDLLLERGVNVFELRYFKRAPYPKKLFGVDDVIVHIQESPNSHEIRYNVENRHGSDVEFTEDEHNILTAYLPDTPKNRRILAKTIFIAKWEIIALYTNEGTIPKVQIQEEIKELAEKLGIKPPPDMRSHAQMLRGRRQPEQPEPAIPEPTPKTVKKAGPMNKEEAENTVFERYDGLVAFLQNKHGQHWKATSEYKQVLKPEIDKLMGIVPGVAKTAEDPQDTKPVEPAGAGGPRQDEPAGTAKRPWEKGQPAGGPPANGPPAEKPGSLVGQ